MINLLPPPEKKQLRAGRTNVLLVRYAVILFSGAVFLALSLVISFYYLSAIKINSEQTVAENVKKENTYSAVKTEADVFRQELASAKTVLDSEVSYSKAILAVARLLPAGTAIDSLKLDQSTFGSPMTLSVKITGESAARQLLDNLNNSSVVSAVAKGAITVNNTGSYPYTMEVTFTLSKEAAQ